MKKRNILIIVALTLIAAVGFIVFGEKEADKHEVLAKDLKESSATAMVPVLNVPMTDQNLLYCVTFQLAWNELMDNVIKEDIILGTEKVYSTELNLQKFTKSSLSDADYIAMVGMGKDDIVKRINDEMDRKFNEEDKWKVESEVGPDDYLAFSFLKKVLTFETSFEKVEEGLDFKGTKVASFGIMDVKDPETAQKLRDQVELVHYVSDDEFIIRLKDSDEKEDLFLARLPKEETLEGMLEKAETLVSEPIPLTSYDRLNIPLIAFDIKKSYKEFIGQPVMNKGFESYSIGEALQRIEFILNESGAVLKSKAEIMMPTSMPMDPKSLILDDSFLLYMKETGKQEPYLAIYVDNAEILQTR